MSENMEAATKGAMSSIPEEGELESYAEPGKVVSQKPTPKRPATRNVSHFLVSISYLKQSIDSKREYGRAAKHLNQTTFVLYYC